MSRLSGGTYRIQNTGLTTMTSGPLHPLKCCLPDIKLSTEAKAAMQSTPETLADHSPGSNIELVDHPDDIPAPQSHVIYYYTNCK